MATLPTVLMTDTIRATQPGQSHGGAFLVDLERGTHRQVIDWNEQNIAWDGRGAERGMRGTAIRGREIFIAVHNRILVFDPEFRLLREHTSPHLGDCHELCLDGETLYAASTRFDSILALDLASGEFTRAWMFRVPWEKDPRTNPGQPQPRPVIVTYDPRSGKGPPAADTVHLNHAWSEDGRLYFSGVLLKHVLYFEGGGLRKHADVPDWTHNARPFRGGVLCNSTGADAICHLDTRGTIIKQFPVVKYDPAALLNVPPEKNAARQGFARGLVATPDGLIIGGSSPGTVSAYDYESGSPVRSVNVSMDVRRAPHGLAVWPW